MIVSNDIKKNSWEMNCNHEEECFDFIRLYNNKTTLYGISLLNHGKCSNQCKGLPKTELSKYSGVFSDYIRSDELTKVHNKNHILFSGCSQTFGIGIENVDDIWSKIVYSSLKNCDGYFNIARPGNTITDIIFDIKQYIQKYGKPKTIVCLLPPIRREIFSFIHSKKHVSQQEIDFTYFIQKRNIFLLLDLFNNFCQTNNIKLILSTWSKETDNDFKEMEIKSYYSIFNKNEDSIFWETLLQDDGHWNYEHHKKFAKVIGQYIN